MSTEMAEVEKVLQDIISVKHSLQTTGFKKIEDLIQDYEDVEGR